MATPHAVIAGDAAINPRPVLRDVTESQPSPHPLHALVSGLAPELRSTLCQASELERRRRARLREEPLSTTVPALDQVLGGGLPRGAMVELVGRGSCGRMAALLAALRAVTDTGEVAALIDLGSHLDPQAAAELGVELERLLWLRPRRLPEALAAADLLVSTGFTLVAVDLGLPPVRGRAPLAAWLRLARSSAAHRAAVLVSTPYRLSGCAAAAVVSVRGQRGRWSGAVGSPRLLTGINASFRLTRQPGRGPGENRDAIFVVADAMADSAASRRVATVPNALQAST